MKNKGEIFPDSLLSSILCNIQVACLGEGIAYANLSIFFCQLLPPWSFREGACCLTLSMQFAHTYSRYVSCSVYCELDFGLLFSFLVLRFYFCRGPFLKSLLNFFTMLFLFYVLVFWPWGMWNLSSSSRARTHTPYTGRLSLNRWTTREVSWAPIFQFSFY